MKRKEKDISKEILLNIMYNGSYIDNESDNIGHEIINLYKSDGKDGKNYIYVLPYGTMDKKHCNRISTILLVRRLNEKTLEILARTEGELMQLVKGGYGKPTKNNEKYKAPHEEQIKLIKEKNITYGGKRLDEIFKNNNHSEIDIQIFATFEAEKVIKVNQPVYLTRDETLKGKENYIFLENKEINFPKQSPKTYLSESEHAYDQNREAIEIIKVINKKELWGDETPKVDIENLNKKGASFLEIIRKEYDELAYSNMLRYFFELNRDVFCRFAKEVLGINLDNSFKIEREKHNIDLLITDKNHVIVIENKIKSGINGVKDKNKIGENQLITYYKTINENYKGKIKHFFILTPNYVSFVDLEQYDKSGEYKHIKYRDILNFYQKEADNFKGNGFYFEEFISALKKQSKDNDNSLEEEMYRRFRKAIEEA